MFFSSRRGFVSGLAGAVSIVLAIGISVSCSRNPLPKGDWGKDNYKVLNGLIEECGTPARGGKAKGDKATAGMAKADGADSTLAGKAYAVFDFDNTTICGTPEITAMAWQIENLAFKIDPEDMWTVLTGSIPDIDSGLVGFEGVSARMLATDILNDYNWLYDNYIAPKNGQKEVAVEEYDEEADAEGEDGKGEGSEDVSESGRSGDEVSKSSRKEENSGDKGRKETRAIGAGEDLAKIHESEQYKDFRAKVWALSAGADATFGYEVGCLWPLRLYRGMTRGEVREMINVSTDEALNRKGHHGKPETWTSPSMGEAGEVTVEVFDKSLRIDEDIVSLYKAMKNNGIDVYICSASFEDAVEAIACDPKYGFDVPADHVFGIRISGGDRIGFAQYDRSYPGTFRSGKTEAIKRFMAPSHGGSDPVLVAGDSMGDYEMLTDFAGLKVGLLVSPSAEELKALAGESKSQSENSGVPRYIVKD